MILTAIRVRHALGLLAVLVALAGRIASGTVVLDVEAARADATLLDTMIQCRADAPAPLPTDPARPAHHEAEHALDVLVSLLDLPAPTTTVTPTLPPPRAGVALHLARLPAARGPPPHPPGAALPRGPPVLA